MGTALGKMAERAKVQRTLSRPDDEPEQRVSMQAVETVPEDEAVDGEAAPAKASRKRKINKSAAAAKDDATDDDDASEVEQPKKKGRKKAAGGRGGRGGRRKAAAGTE